MTRVAGIVLAAGESRRMGRAKALLPWNGRTFLESVVTALQAGGADPILVVLGHDAETIRAGARTGPAGIVLNDDYRRGQFSSLQAGVATLPPGCAAALVALVDQPHASPELVRMLIEAFVASGAPIVRPAWRGRGGHPLLLSAETFAEIVHRPAEATTFDIVQKFRDRMIEVPAPDDSILVDFDTPEELAAHRAASGTAGGPPAGGAGDAHDPEAHS
jgi:CTP:molybdopterin cytidylyltransferase MocA